MSDIAIEAKALFKSYGRSLALSDFSVEVKKGQVFALLGPNGAGKTTFVKCLLGLIKKDKGVLTLNGLDVSDYRSRKNVAYLPERFTFFDFETAQGCVTFFAQMRDVEKNKISEVVDYALKKVGILDLKNRKVKGLSKGQLQRVGMASMLVGDPDIFFLDEPFSGLDPLGIKDLKDVIIELKNKGKTFFINSHILSEMELICDHFAILNHGQCLAQGELKSVLNGKKLETFFEEKVRPAKESL